MRTAWVRRLSSDRESISGQHADAALTTGPGENGASPRFGQMQPSVRRGLSRLNIEGRERVAQDGLPPAQLLTLKFDDLPSRSHLRA